MVSQENMDRLVGILSKKSHELKDSLDMAYRAKLLGDDGISEFYTDRADKLETYLFGAKDALVALGFGIDMVCDEYGRFVMTAPDGFVSRWEPEKDYDGTMMFRCPICGNVEYKDSNYCSSCGAELYEKIFGV